MEYCTNLQQISGKSKIKLKLKILQDSSGFLDSNEWMRHGLSVWSIDE